MGSRFEDKVSKILKQLNEQSNDLLITSTFDWSDWEDLSLGEKIAQIEGKLINFPKIGVDPAKMSRKQGD